MRDKPVGFWLTRDSVCVHTDRENSISKASPRNEKKAVDVTHWLNYGPPKSGIARTVSKTLT